MMKFWTNFAKTGKPGESTNSISWSPYITNEKKYSYIILDNKRNLRMEDKKISFKSLTQNLITDSRLNDLEKCVVLLQMFTFVGNDLYDENIMNYPNKCNRDDSEAFLIENASFIEY